jgi:hypothetical protein
LIEDVQHSLPHTLLETAREPKHSNEKRRTTAKLLLVTPGHCRNITAELDASCQRGIIPNARSTDKDKMLEVFGISHWV